MYKYMYILAQINSAYKYEAYNDVKSAYLYANWKNPAKCKAFPVWLPLCIKFATFSK